MDMRPLAYILIPQYPYPPINAHLLTDTTEAHTSMDLAIALAFATSNRSVSSFDPNVTADELGAP